MAINFPTPSSLNQIFADPVSGNVYQWSGTISPLNGVWVIKNIAASGGGGGSGGNANIYVGETPPLAPGLNQLWWNSSNGRMYLYYDDSNTIQWVETSPALASAVNLPVGTIVPMATQTVPAGFMECDGRSISRTTYSGLFAILGTVWGIGDGVNSFNIPDLRGEFLRGWDHGKFVDNVGTFTANKTNGSNTLTGLAIKQSLIANGMLVTGLGIPNNTVITGSTAVSGIVQTLTLSNLVSGSGSISVNIFGRQFASKQDDMFESHNHGLTYSKPDLAAAIDGSLQTQISASGANTAITTDAGGYETRPRNVAVMYVIKVFDAVSNPTNISVSNLSNDVTALQNRIKKYISTSYTFTNASLLSIPHNLGVVPDNIRYYIKNISGSIKGGVNPNETVEVYADRSVGISNNGRGFSTVLSNTTARIKFANTSGSPLMFIDQSTGLEYGVVPADWEFYIVALHFTP